MFFYCCHKNFDPVSMSLRDCSGTLGYHRNIRKFQNKNFSKLVSKSFAQNKSFKKVILNNFALYGKLRRVHSLPCRSLQRWWNSLIFCTSLKISLRKNGTGFFFYIYVCCEIFYVLSLSRHLQLFGCVVRGQTSHARTLLINQNSYTLYLYT